MWSTLHLIMPKYYVKTHIPRYVKSWLVSQIRKYPKHPCIRINLISLGVQKHGWERFNFRYIWNYIFWHDYIDAVYSTKGILAKVHLIRDCSSSHINLSCLFINNSKKIITNYGFNFLKFFQENNFIKKLIKLSLLRTV